VSLLSWETVLGAVVAVDNGYDDVARTLLLAYPVADVVMVVLAVLLLAHTRGDRTALNLVGLGVLAQAIADSTFAFLTATSNYDGGSVDVGWVDVPGRQPPAGGPAPRRRAAERAGVRRPLHPRGRRLRRRTRRDVLGPPADLG
jgi:hypothetical protein